MINKGAIAEQGTHDELLKLNGVYKKLVLRQLEKNASDFNEDDDENDDFDPSPRTKEDEGNVNSDKKSIAKDDNPGLVRQLSDSLM